tara:strand:+ start:7954 stop:8079 length:126 start_codon:yes stop_codon:yes gene_type:complete
MICGEVLKHRKGDFVSNEGCLDYKIVSIEFLLKKSNDLVNI